MHSTSVTLPASTWRRITHQRWMAQRMIGCARETVEEVVVQHARDDRREARICQPLTADVVGNHRRDFAHALRSQRRRTMSPYSAAQDRPPCCDTKQDECCVWGLTWLYKGPHQRRRLSELKGSPGSIPSQDSPTRMTAECAPGRRRWGCCRGRPCRTGGASPFS